MACIRHKQQGESQTAEAILDLKVGPQWVFPSVASHCLKLERALHFPRGCCPPALMRSVWSFWKPTKGKWKNIHVKMGACVVQVNLCGPYEISSKNSWYQQYLILRVTAHTALEEIKTSERFFFSTLLRKYPEPPSLSLRLTPVLIRILGDFPKCWWDQGVICSVTLCEASVLSRQTAVKPLGYQHLPVITQVQVQNTGWALWLVLSCVHDALNWVMLVCCSMLIFKFLSRSAMWPVTEGNKCKLWCKIYSISLWTVVE